MMESFLVTLELGTQHPVTEIIGQLQEHGSRLHMIFGTGYV